MRDDSKPPQSSLPPLTFMPVKRDFSPGCGTYIVAMLIGAGALGIVLPMMSGFVDGQLYHDADRSDGIIDDTFGHLVPMFWYTYSVFYGAVLGALSKASFLDRRPWFGIVWMLVSVVFYFFIPANRPHGEMLPSGEPNLLSFRVFYLAPAWLCGIVAVTGLLLFLRSLWSWLKNREATE